MPAWQRNGNGSYFSNKTWLLTLALFVVVLATLGHNWLFPLTRSLIDFGKPTIAMSGKKHVGYFVSDKGRSHY